MKFPLAGEETNPGNHTGEEPSPIKSPVASQETNHGNPIEEAQVKIPVVGQQVTNTEIPTGEEVGPPMKFPVAGQETNHGNSAGEEPATMKIPVADQQVTSQSKLIKFIKLGSISLIKK